MKTNTTKFPAKSTYPFAPVARRLNTWRATRRRGQRIPKELWQAAAELARTYGLKPTASALKLNYRDLQRRLEQEPPLVPPPAAPMATSFWELPAPALAAPSQSSWLDVTRASGERLSLRLGSIDSADVSNLVQAFLRS